MLRDEAEPWEPIPMIQNDNEDQEPTSKEKSCTTKMDATNGWTTMNSTAQTNHSNDKMEENKKRNEKIEKNSKREK